MPKELTHWYLAGKVAESVGVTVQAGTSGYEQVAFRSQPEGAQFPALGRCIQACPRVFLLGAVGPDFLFYYLHGPEREAFQAAAMVLHGRDGGNTLRPFSSVVEAYGGTFGLAVGAFLLGYLVHVVGDAVFHPLVLYTVGKGPGRSQYEHHVFESALDLYVWERWGKEPGIPKTLRQLTQGMERTGELSRKEFLRLLGVMSFLGGAYSEEGLETCLRRYEILQNWFWAPLACKATQVLKTLNQNLAFLEASCYQRRFYRYGEAFTNPLEYRHPVTGVERRARIEDLVKETVEQFFTYAGQVEKLFQQAVIETNGAQVEAGVSDRESILNGFRSLKGPNLETGIHGDRADRILYTRREGLEGLFGPYGYRYR